MRSSAKIIERGNVETIEGGFIGDKYIMRQYPDGLLEVRLLSEIYPNVHEKLGESFDHDDLINQVRRRGYLLISED